MKHDIRFLLIVTALLLMTGAGVAQKFGRENNLGRMLMIC